MLELTLILEAMLDCSKEFQYSNAIIYFLVDALSSLATNGLKNLEAFA